MIHPLRTGVVEGFQAPLCMRSRGRFLTHGGSEKDVPGGGGHADESRVVDNYLSTAAYAAVRKIPGCLIVFITP